MITSINNFPNIPSLENLSISNNNISDLSSFLNAIKAKFPRLRSLNTFRNPMNPGANQAQQYGQYKSYVKQLGTVTELDGMNINDNSYMQQQRPKQDLFSFGGAGGATQQQPKRDLFGTNPQPQQPKRDLFGTTPAQPQMQPQPQAQPAKVNFFDTPAQSAPAAQNAASMSNMMNSMQNKPKVGFFDAAAPAQANTNMNSQMNQMANNQTNMNNRGGSMAQMMGVTATGGSNQSVSNTQGQVFRRQFFVIDESAEIDGTEFVNSKKMKSVIMVNEKILKKSDNMTKFNRKNKSEGNKHILNSDL